MILMDFPGHSSVATCKSFQFFSRVVQQLTIFQYFRCQRIARSLYDSCVSLAWRINILGRDVDVAEWPGRALSDRYI